MIHVSSLMYLSEVMTRLMLVGEQHWILRGKWGAQQTTNMVHDDQQARYEMAEGWISKDRWG